MPYTDTQVAALHKAAEQFGTLNSEIAGKLADDLGQSKRSVIAKIGSLGLPYAAAKRPVKGTRATSKAEYVAAIAKALDADARDLDGLEKATARALSDCWRRFDDLADHRMVRSGVHGTRSLRNRHRRGETRGGGRIGIINGAGA